MTELLTPEQQKLVDVWNQHLAAEFGAKDTEAALLTMTEEPHVTEVGLMLGGAGKEGVRTFYSRHFLSQIPNDVEMIPVSRTVGQSRLVDEMLVRFTHSIQTDWVLPGVPATGRRIEIAMVAIITFEGDKIASEHLYWDQASVLVQAGLLDPGTLPVSRGAGDVHKPTLDAISRAQ